MRRRILSNRLGTLLVVALALAAPLAVGGHIGSPRANGTAPVSQEAFDAVSAAPADTRLWAVEGKITNIDAATRSLTVNGFSFRVPNRADNQEIDIGDPAGPSADSIFIRWELFVATPKPLGWTAIANGHFEPSANANSITFIADHVFVEEGEFILMGPVTTKHATAGDDQMYVNGVRVLKETDRRFAAHNSFKDLAGQDLDFRDIPEGTIIIAEGFFDVATNRMYARAIEADFIKPTPPGQPDAITIDRAEARVDSGELRVQGVGSRTTETITLYASTDETHTCADMTGGTPIASGLAIDPLDNVWSFRGRDLFPPGAPYRAVCAVSTGGGEADRPTTVS